EIGQRCRRFFFTQGFDALLLGAHEFKLPDFRDVLEHFRRKCEAVFRATCIKTKGKIWNSGTAVDDRFGLFTAITPHRWTLRRR
ncbi:MAG: hypothetical protein KGI75_08410, partial [Rhizobiaceae bacterium]|nr:hypothetical protein [Rhizobiaceae bacterium]